jgi:2-dehydro-3-deoxygalactonokinase
MDKFLSCDWGTSSFRLRLVQTPDLTILKEKISRQGIAQTFKLWNKSGAAEETRVSFYLEIIRSHVQAFEDSLGQSLGEAKVILSGMVGSSIGMMDLPYKQVPFSLDGSDLIIEKLKDNARLNVDVVVISGAATGDDVLRGEETQLIGCTHSNQKTGQSLFIFPGTHSKHITGERAKAVGFKTYMTGEFFQILSTKSILSVSVEEGSRSMDEKNKRSFENGVEESVKSNLLHGSFQVRTNQLFNKFSKEENYYFLSGLLIGTEMGELMNTHYQKIVLVTTAQLQPYYETAIKMVSPAGTSLEVQDADECLIRGQFQILKRLQ